MLEDKLLIWKFKYGNRDAFRLIYEKYADDMLTLAANLLGDSSAAEDVVQDVFIKFAESVEHFGLTGSLKGYLATCVANRARDYIRQKKRRRVVIIDETKQSASDTNNPVQLVIRDEELQKLSGALTKLPYEQRETIVLHLHSDLRFRQIARLQKVSGKTAYSRYRYGLEKLRSMLNGELKNETGR
ncbi:MAG: RNA polymerase sigma factor [Planctomycetota bacterium]|jgi:RNA polymerase sigma-70 factor (ECF subfamily)